MKNFPTANYSSRVNEMKSKGGRGPRPHAASWTTCPSESVGTQWIFWMRNHFSCAALDTGDFDQWNAWTFLKFLLFFFFCPVKEKKSRGKWWNRKVAACVLTERNERPPQRNGDCFVCCFSLCLHLQGKRTEICDRFTSFFSRPVLLGVGNPKKLIENFFFFLKKKENKNSKNLSEIWDFLGGWKKMQLA